MTTPAAGLLMVALLSGAPEAQPKLLEPVQTFLDYLGARSADCPAGLLAQEIEYRSHCAAIDLDFKRLKKSVNKFLHGDRVVGGAQLGKWSELAGGIQATPLLLPSVVLQLVFDPETSSLVLVPADSCLKAPGLDAPGLYDPANEGIKSPERIEGGPVAFPERARMAKVSGVVVLQAVVRKDGTIGEHCVLYEQPTGYGFLESALHSLDRWTYQPATKDGEPVDRAMTVSIAFEIG